MGLTSFFKIIVDPTRSSSSWVRSPCTRLRTLSFRARDEDVYKTLNSIYFDQTPEWSPQKTEEAEDDDVTCCVVSERFSSVCKEEEESVKRGLRSDRMFFERRGETSSIVLVEPTTSTITTVAASASASVLPLISFVGEDYDDDEEEEEEEEEDLVPFKESVAEEMESGNPYMDFRISMEEMVISHGVKDWECLEKLLEWYLRMNTKKTHGFIVEAFIDLLLDLATFISSSTGSPSSSPSSCLCTSSSSSSSLTTTTTTTTTATTRSSSSKSSPLKFAH